jgi:drug/metabolite transporter (DMT)-like permease
LNRHTRIEQAGSRAGNAAAAAAALFTVFVWALAFPLTRIALGQFEPLPLAAIRFGIAALLILGWLAWQRPAVPPLRDGLRFALCGLIGIAIYNALFNAGQQTVSASAGSFILNTGPVLTAILATLFLGERFTRWGWGGAALGFAGVGIIVAGQPGGLSFGSGAVLIFGAAAAQAVFFVLQRPLVQRYGALASTAYSLLAGSLMLTPWLGQGLTTLTRPGIAAPAVVAVVSLAIFPAVLGYAAWSHAIGHFGAARSATFLYLVPPAATALAFGISGEVPGAMTIVGGLIAVAGVAVVNAKGRPAAQAGPAVSVRS